MVSVLHSDLSLQDRSRAFPAKFRSLFQDLEEVGVRLKILDMTRAFVLTPHINWHIFNWGGDFCIFLSKFSYFLKERVNSSVAHFHFWKARARQKGGSSEIYQYTEGLPS